MKKLIAPILLLTLLLTAAGCNTPVVSGPSQTGTAASSKPSAAAASAAPPASPSLSPSPTEKAFVFTRQNFPRMDGSTSTIPLGQAVACVLLGVPRDKVTDLAMFNKTTESFRNLMKGSADILIVAEPSANVFDEMKQAGFTYEMKPIATDALIFMVNADNPVNNLTTEQVREIYSGEITNWKQVGGADAKIEAFQRNTESGSQALMDKLVMRDLKMMPAPQGYSISEMEGLVSAVKSFDGSASAIGYTVYYYASDMKMADGLKILSIDGVKPSDDTIASKKYPYLNPYYAVISANASKDSPARILFNWLLSPEGQNLIKIEGYVPIAG